MASTVTGRIRAMRSLGGGWGVAKKANTGCRVLVVGL